MEGGERHSFPKEEEAILKLWDEIKAFETSVKMSEGKKEFSFFDGPPFATGLPHYGHILAGTIKDIVTRFAHQTGHHVTRRFGWDTHGLPIEFEIDKELGIKSKDQVLELGIAKYNEECRKIVMRYSKEWRTTVNRVGRWIDFDNDYKTMNPTFMESVWWVCKQLFDKGIFYRGFKVMPYSTGCTTPLSNFEVTQNYKDVSDPSVIVTFPLVDEPEVKLIAWTTTPWTLPSNMGVCVHPTMTYVKIQEKKTNEIYILAESRLPEIFKQPKKKGGDKENKDAASASASAAGAVSNEIYDVLEKFPGSKLAGKKYIPLFNYYYEAKKDTAFFILNDTYVTDDSGTGVVHQAPAFGEDDFRVCKANGIITSGEDLPLPIDANGRFTNPVKDFLGMYIKDADKEILAQLKREKRLFRNESFVHSYPFCWRSDTPLIYRAIPSWFVSVEKFKDRLVTNNQNTYWVPDWVKEKRFHNWLVDARDWAVSRNRYWGTPIPIWTNEDASETVCIGSIDELEKLSGVRVTDLHRESIDHIVIPSQKGPEFPPLKRVEEVFDCWFESGSMPYAQYHYPFENQELFNKSFPADFIAEGLDQTRGWFYTLLVLSTALFDKPPFKNLIVNGLVLASDGKKMSKRLKNYPPPTDMINSYGADALRLYLINSPVVRGEPLKFNQDHLRDVVKDVQLPWLNAFRFFQQCLPSDDYFRTKKEVTGDATVDVLDVWIIAASRSLLNFVHTEMKAYRLYTVVPRLVKFIEQLTNWYVRFNRKRLKGSKGEAQQQAALNTLLDVLLLLCKIMSPFTPFFTEYLYQSLKKYLPDDQQFDSVHYMMLPEPSTDKLNEEIEEGVAFMQTIIEAARVARDRRKLPLKIPCKELIAVLPSEKILNEVKELIPLIAQEINVKDVILTTDSKAHVTRKAIPDFQKLGPKVKGDRKKVQVAIESLVEEDIEKLFVDGSLVVLGYQILADEVKESRQYKGDQKIFEAIAEKDVVTILSVSPSQELLDEGVIRQVINFINRMRKKAGFNIKETVDVYFELPSNDEYLIALLTKESKDIETATSGAFKAYAGVKGNSNLVERATASNKLNTLKIGSSQEKEEEVVLRVFEAFN